jgi:hypothetical protein
MSPRFKIYFFAKEAFQVSLLLYILALGAEMLRPGIVSNFLNLNIVLGVVLISGLSMAITEKSQR